MEELNCNKKVCPDCGGKLILNSMAKNVEIITQDGQNINSTIRVFWCENRKCNYKYRIGT